MSVFKSPLWSLALCRNVMMLRLVAYSLIPHCSYCENVCKIYKEHFVHRSLEMWYLSGRWCLQRTTYYFFVKEAFKSTVGCWSWGLHSALLLLLLFLLLVSSISVADVRWLFCCLSPLLVTAAESLSFPAISCSSFRWQTFESSLSNLDSAFCHLAFYHMAMIQWHLLLWKSLKHLALMLWCQMLDQ